MGGKHYIGSVNLHFARNHWLTVRAVGSIGLQSNTPQSDQYEVTKSQIRFVQREGKKSLVGTVTPFLASMGIQNVGKEGRRYYFQVRTGTIGTITNY